jgi:hypothetical protein
VELTNQLQTARQWIGCWAYFFWCALLMASGSEELA